MITQQENQPSSTRIYPLSNNLKHCAHIGDAVWELYVREIIIDYTQSQKEMHRLSVKFVKAAAQAQFMRELETHLTETELELAKRARNLPLGVSKKSDPAIHSAATAFEALIGHLHLNDKLRLQEILGILKSNNMP